MNHGGFFLHFRLWIDIGVRKPCFGGIYHSFKKNYTYTNRIGLSLSHVLEWLLILSLAPCLSGESFTERLVMKITALILASAANGTPDGYMFARMHVLIGLVFSAYVSKCEIKE